MSSDIEKSWQYVFHGIPQYYGVDSDEARTTGEIAKLRQEQKERSKAELDLQQKTISALTAINNNQSLISKSNWLNNSEATQKIIEQHIEKLRHIQFESSIITSAKKQILQ